VGVFLYVLVRINTISVTIDRQVLISLVSGAGGNESDISKTFLREISPRGDSHGRSFVGCHDKKTFFRCGILDGNFSNFVGAESRFLGFPKLHGRTWIKCPYSHRENENNEQEYLC